MSEQTYQHGEGCCQCKCMDGEIGFGGCCLLTCCPCFSLMQAAEKIDEPGMLHFFLGCCRCACCSVMMLGDAVEKKRNIKTHGTGWHCLNAFFDGCTCQSCRVVNECSVYEKEGAVSAPTSTEMVRN